MMLGITVGIIILHLRSNHKAPQTCFSGCIYSFLMNLTMKSKSHDRFIGNVDWSYAEKAVVSVYPWI